MLKRRAWFRRRRLSDQSRLARVNHYLGHYFILRLHRLKAVAGLVIGWSALAFLMGLLLINQIRGLSDHYQDKSPARGGIYVEGRIGSLSNLNPIYATSNVDQIASRLLFAGLFSYDQAGYLKPNLARSLEPDQNDQRRQRLRLKPGLVWQDGQPLTAADVVFTVQTIQNPASLSPLRSAWAGIGVELVDELTVDFYLPGHFSPFPTLLTLAPLPQHRLAAIPPDQLRRSDFNQAPVGSGAFRFLRLTPVAGPSPDQPEIRLELTANQNYHRPGQPRLDGFVLHLVADSQRLAELFNQGKLTGAGGLAADLINLADDDYRRLDLTTSDGVYLFFNNAQSPWNQPQWRRFLADQLKIEPVLADFNQPHSDLSGPLLTNHLGYFNYLLKAGPADPAGWLADQGYSLNPAGLYVRDGQPLTVRLTVPAETVYVQLADAIKAHLAGAGITVVIDSQDQAGFATTVLSNHDYGDWLIYGLNLGSDPDVFAFWHSSQIDSHSVLRLNLANFRSEAADDALEKGRSRWQPELRTGHYHSFQQIWAEQVPALPLYRVQRHYYIRQPATGLDSQIIVGPADLFNRAGQLTVLTESRTRPDR